MRAEVLKEHGDWDAGLACYHSSRRHAENAADAILRSGVPNARELQEWLLNSSATTIDLLLRSTETARRQHDELVQLRAELARVNDALRAALEHVGVHVTNTAQVVATVEQQAQLVQQVELSVRHTLDELARTATAAGLNEAIAQKATKLAKSAEQGPGFIERAKQFTGDLAAIVQNVGAVAAPLVPLVERLGHLLGVG